MTRNIPDIVMEIEALQTELDDALTQRRGEFDFEMEGEQVVFDQAARAHHTSLKRSLMKQLMEAHPLVLLTAPVIYSVALPFALLDLMVSIYQAVCFPVYRIAKVPRRQHVIFDRHYLAYLNLFEKMNCIYCSYATGVLSYAQEITSRTEQYWCPIKHARHILGAHSRYMNFLEYGDAEAYRDERIKLREKLRSE